MKEGNFMEGTGNFRKSSVIDHEGSKLHRKACELRNVAIEATNLGSSQSAAGKTLRQLKENEREILHILFRNAQACCKTNRPLSNYQWILEQ
jgi:hypothetical protein